MSLVFLKLSGSSASDSFVPGACWRKSLNSLKIQSWHLTTWNAEENPNPLFPLLVFPVFSVQTGFWNVAGIRVPLIHPFHLFVLTQFMPCPLSIPDCLLVEQLSEQSARGAKIPRSHSSWSHFFLFEASLDNSIVQTFLGWAKFPPHPQNWPSLFFGIEGHLFSMFPLQVKGIS